MFASAAAVPTPDPLTRAALDAMGAVTAVDVDSLTDAQIRERVMLASRLQAMADAMVVDTVGAFDALPLDVGAVSRTATPAQWRALIAYAGGCETPGCGAPVEWTEAHHSVPWEDEHRTFLRGLILLCRGHHHLIHKKGWTIARREDGMIVVTRPGMRPLIGTPRHGLSNAS